MHTHKGKRNPVFRYWKPFLAFLLSVTLFGVFVLVYNLNSNRNYIDQMRIYSFQQACTQLGYILEQFKSQAADFRAEPEVGSDESLSITAEESSVFEKLNDLEKRANIESNAFFYVRGQSGLYSTRGKRSYEQIQMDYGLYNFTQACFFSRLNTTTASSICRIPSKDNASAMIAVICPIPGSGISPYADVFFLIDEDVLMEKFVNYFGNSTGEICVFNNTLEIVLSTGQPAPSAKLLRQYKGIGLISEPHADKVILRYGINSDLTVISIMPRQEFYRDIFSNQAVLLLLIILLILCCTVIAILGVKNTYQPIRNLAQDILGSDQPQENELELIRDAFDTSQEHNRSLMQQLSQQNQLLSNQFVLRLISGRFQGIEEIKYYARCFGLDVNRKYWVVMQLVISDLPGSRRMIDKLLDDLADFKIPNADCLYTEFLLHPGICCLFHFYCDGDADGFCKNIAYLLCQFIQQQGLSSFRIGVGSPCTNPIDARRSSYEADAAMEIACNAEDQYLYFYHVEQSVQAGDIRLPSTEKSMLTTAITRGDTDVALSALNFLIDYIENNAKSFILVRLFCSELSGILLRAAQENKITYYKNNWTALVIYDNLDAFRASSNELTGDLCRHIYKRQELDSIKKKNEVLGFITQNFTRDDFSLDLIADSLNLTKSKISAILKEDVGMGFPQYISLLRINEVKRQLVVSQKPIKDIIRGVGYLDVPNFSRRFKSLVGVTPGQYRRLHQAE